MGANTLVWAFLPPWWGPFLAYFAFFWLPLSPVSGESAYGMVIEYWIVAVALTLVALAAKHAFRIWYSRNNRGVYVPTYRY